MSFFNSRKLKDQVIWLTGASQGIGESLAIALAEKEAKVIISARSKDKLESLAKKSDNLIPMACDVTNMDELKDCQTKIESQFGMIDIFIGNAGTCEYLDVSQYEADMMKRVMTTNYFGLVNCLEVALPLLRKSKAPYIIGMSSTVSYMGLPRAEAYGASKAAISYFLDSLRSDLHIEGFKISEICPGFVKTPLTDVNDFPMPFRISAEKAADYIVRGIEKESYEIHFPKRFSLIFKLLASLPRSLKYKVTQGMSRNQ